MCVSSQINQGVLVNLIPFCLKSSRAAQCKLSLLKRTAAFTDCSSLCLLNQVIN